MRETSLTNAISTTCVYLNVHKYHVPYITHVRVIRQTLLNSLRKTSVLQMVNGSNDILGPLRDKAHILGFHQQTQHRHNY